MRTRTTNLLDIERAVANRANPSHADLFFLGMLQAAVKEHVIHDLVLHFLRTDAYAAASFGDDPQALDDYVRVLAAQIDGGLQ